MVKISETQENLKKVLRIVQKRNLYDADISLAEVVILLDKEIEQLETQSTVLAMHNRRLLEENAVLSRDMRKLVGDMMGFLRNITERESADGKEAE